MTFAARYHVCKRSFQYLTYSFQPVLFRYVLEFLFKSLISTELEDGDENQKRAKHDDNLSLASGTHQSSTQSLIDMGMERFSMGRKIEDIPNMITN